MCFRVGDTAPRGHELGEARAGVVQHDVYVRAELHHAGEGGGEALVGGEAEGCVEGFGEGEGGAGEVYEYHWVCVFGGRGGGGHFGGYGPGGYCEGGE